MSKHADATDSSFIERLLIGKTAKARHPITCLNPAPTFTIIGAKIDNGRVFVRGEETMWFGESVFELTPSETAMHDGSDGRISYDELIKANARQAQQLKEQSEDIAKLKATPSAIAMPSISPEEAGYTSFHSELEVIEAVNRAHKPHDDKNSGLAHRLRQSVAACRLETGGPIERGMIRTFPLELAEEAAAALEATRSATLEPVGWASLGTENGKWYVRSVRSLSEGRNDYHAHPLYVGGKS